MLFNRIKYLFRDHWFPIFSRLALGSIFLIAGAGKLPHGAEFSSIVVGYGLLPEGLAQVYAMLLPWAEIIIGSLLILGVLPKITSSISIAIIASFVITNIYALTSGPAGGLCGCFGEVIPLTHTQSLVTNFAMLSIALFLLLRQYIEINIRSVFRIFFRPRAAISIPLVIIMLIISIPAPVLATNNTKVEIPEAQDTGVKVIKADPDVTHDRLEDTVKPTLMYFYNGQCPGCMMQKPVIDAIEQEYGDSIIIERVNSQDNMALLREYNITSVPTMIVANRRQTNDNDSYQKFVGFTKAGILKENLDVPVKTTPEIPLGDISSAPLSVSSMSAEPLGGNQNEPLPSRFAAPFDSEPTVADLVAPTGQTLYWPSGATVATFGPNAGITIDMGTILSVGGCSGSGGVDDWIYPYSDIYIVPSGSVSIGSTLVDAGGSKNTVWGASGGIFISQTIGYTSPGGNVGPGTYAVVYDECQNGVLDSIDALFDPAFEVVIAADVPPMPASFAAVKENAAEQATYHLLLQSDLQQCFDAYDFANDVLAVPECILSPAKCLLNFALDKIKSEISSALGISIDAKAETLSYVGNMAQHYLGIAADPPDPDYRELTPLAPIEYVDAQTNDPVLLAIADFTNSVITEDALVEALLTSIERYQGADASSDGEWALIHARATRDYANALAYQLVLTNATITSLDAVLTADTRPFDDALVTLDDYQGRMETSGFTDNETLYLLNIGMLPADIDELSDEIADPDYSGLSKTILRDYLADLADANTDAIASLSTFTIAMDGIITTLLADPYAFQRRPVADANGPYTADEGSSLMLDGTGSSDPDGTVTAWGWDLDMDSEFDNASGDSPSVSFNQAFNGVVGLQVTDNASRTGIDYAFMSVANINSPPSIDSFSPASLAQEVELGDTLGFSITTSDPDGDTVTSQWTLDGVNTATGNSFSYAPTDVSELGMRIIQVQVSDDSPLGGTVTQTWGVSVLAVDADGDGWRANIDCDDSDPDVNPGMTEIIGNGIDDDCNVMTADQPPVVDFSFSPTSPLADDDVYFTDASYDPDGFIVEWDWNFGDGENSSAQNPVHSYTSGGTFTVTLTVTDNSSGVADTSQVINVLSPPEAAFTAGKAMNVASLDDGASIVDYSSVYSSSASYQPENAIDGSTSTAWYTANGQTNDQWLKIALSGNTPHLIDRVILRNNAATSGVQNFHIRVSDEGTDDADFTTVFSGTVPQDHDSHEFTFAPVSARYVQLYVDDNWGYATYTMVPHFEVHTLDRQGGIVSLLEGLPPTVVDYSSQYSGFSPERMLKDSGSYWATAAGETTNQWAKIELGGGHTYTIERVILDAPYVDYGIQDFEIRVSTTTSDDAAFSTVFTGTALNNTEEQEFAFAPVEARYVQLYIVNNYGGNYVRVATFKVLTPDRSNVAELDGVGAFIVGRSSQYNDSSYAAENAIDFNESSYWQTAAGQVSNQWIKVRLIPGSPYLIDRVKIKYAGGSFAPQDFEIRVSNTTIDDAAFTPVYSGTLPNNNMPHWTVFTPVPAKYVQLYIYNNHGGSSIRLNDFQVYSPQIGGAVVPFQDITTEEDGIDSWSWEFGDGDDSPEQHPFHTYAAPGTYTVTLTTTDSDGLTDTASMDYTVLHAPDADFTWTPTVPDEGQNTSFTDISTDSDGLILGWLWQFPHISTQYTSSNPSTSFPDNDDYDVTLTVTDSQLLTSAVTYTVTTENVPPTVDAGRDLTVFWGQDWAATLPLYSPLNSSVSDRGTADRASLVVDWDFGDGGSAHVDNATITTCRVSRAYSDPGIYVATMTATDKDGGISTDNTTVTVVKRGTTQKIYATLSSEDGDEINVVSKLWDTFNIEEIIEGRTVTFTLGSQVETAVTDAEGYAKAVLAGSENDTVSAEFAGDDYYTASSATGTVKAAPLLPVGDIIFAIDESGSMGPDIADVKANVANIAAQLDGNIDYQLGLVGFGAGSAEHWEYAFPGTPQNMPDGKPHIHSVLSENVTSFDTALDDLIASGGVEPGFSAVVLATSSAMGYFRTDCPSCIIVITDEAAGTNITEANPETREDAVAALDARNAVFLGIVNPTYSEYDYGPDPGSLAEATNGEVWDILDFRSNPDPVLYAIMDKCVARIIEESSANLSVNKIANPEPVIVGENLTYTIEIANEGPADAIGITAADTLSENVTFVSAVASQGVCTESSGTVECELDTLEVGATATVTIVVTTAEEGSVTNTVTVSNDRFDPDESNNSATVVSTVRPDNNPPAAVDDAYSVNEGDMLNVSAPGVLENDNDADDDPLSAILSVTSANGTLNLNADGSFTYTPDIDFSGSDNFTYAASDGIDESNIATVIIQVNRVNNPPVADVNGPYTEYEGNPVNFDGTGSYDSDGTIADYAWDFGDGSTDAGPTPQYTYSDNGTFTVTLVVTDNEGATDTATTTATISDLSPSADFSWNPEPQDEGLAISFTDTSISSPDSIISWAWDFAGLGASTDQNPSFTFQDNGIYTITLTVTDDDGSTDTASHDATILDLSPTAALSGDTMLDEGQSGSYDASGSTSSPDAIVSYEWDWDYNGSLFNPSGDTGAVKSHSWNNDGTYTVAVRVTDDDGSTDIATLFITVTHANVPPVADANGPYWIDIGDDLSLDGTGSYDPDAAYGDSVVLYEWDMNDDGSYEYSGASPTIPWGDLAGLPQPGVAIPIRLRVTDSFGATGSNATTLTIYDNRPVADFTASPNPAAPGQSITFDASVSSHTHPGHSIVLYEWDFDDDGTFDASSPSPTITYAYSSFGTFTATLRVTDDNTPARTDSTSRSIQVNQGNRPPVADANGPYWIDEGGSVIVDASGSTDPDTNYGDSIISYEWDLDDDGNYDDASGLTSTVAFNDDGSYTVGLRVTDSFGMSDTDTGSVNVNDLGPNAEFSWSPEPQDEGSAISFNDLSTSYPDTIVSWAWDFAGLGVSTDQNPSFTFPDNGVYTVMLTVTDDDGSTDSISHDVTVLDLGPTAVLTGDTRLDEGQAGSYDASGSTSSPDAIFSYEWDWEYDGASFNPSGVTGVVQSHSWNDDGSYTVAVRVTDDDGSTDIATLAISISHTNRPPIADANGPYSEYEGSAVSFNGTGSYDPDGTIVDYAWDFGDGSTDTGPTPQYTYTDNGIFIVTLVVTDDEGAKDTATTTATIGDLGPNAEFAWSPALPYAGSSVQFTDQSTSAPDTIASWSWNFGGQGSASAQNPSFTFADGGIYNICLTVTDDDGSTDTVCHDLEVTAEADLSVTKTADPETVMGGDTLVYTVTVNNAGPSDAQNVMVNDTLPPSVTFVSTSGCAEDPNGMPNCSLGTVAAGDSAQYTITVTVDSDATGELINVVSVSSDTPDPNPGNDTTSALTSVVASGRMTGGGNIITAEKVRVTFGFTLHCNTCQGPNNLQVNWGKGNKFHLEQIITASCIDDPSINPNPPDATFDTIEGTGIGRYNGISGATIEWTFTDAGEPGRNDTVRIVIRDAEDKLVLEVAGNLKGGNNQAHSN